MEKVDFKKTLKHLILLFIQLFTESAALGLIISGLVLSGI